MTAPSGATPRPSLRELADNLLIALGLDPDDPERWEAAYHTLHEAAQATEQRLAEAADLLKLIRLTPKAGAWDAYEETLNRIDRFLAAGQPEVGT